MDEGMADTVKAMEEIIGSKWVLKERTAIEGYLRDETPEAIRPQPASGIILVKPSNVREVSEILRFANRNRIPVFPLGGRTGLAGAAIPTKPGIAISLERMNRIEVDRENMMAIAEAGATLGDLIKAAEEGGLSFPLHPGDEGAQIGGLIATNAGGVRAVKYGIMRNFVKGLEVVLPTGDVLSLGGMLIKNNMGYSLLHLFIGSEGTLGVITKAFIKLLPKTRYTVTLVIPFDKRGDAIQSAQRIMLSGITPLALEYVEWEEIDRASKHIRETWPAKGRVQLILILSEVSEEGLLQECEEISRICEENHALETLIAERKEEQDRILRIRSNLYTAIKPYIYDILDVTVPPGRIEELMNKVDAIAERHQTRIPIYGHIGDGNLHAHIWKEEGRGLDFVKKVKREIYEACISLGGVITGEHGLGKVRLEEARFLLAEKEIELMRAIKAVFDPNGIMNPGTIAG
jgi:glycolate oxidase